MPDPTPPTTPPAATPPATPPVTPPATPPTTPPTTPATPPADEWRLMIPDEYKQNQSLQNLQAKDPKEAFAGIIKQMVNAQAQMGKEKVLKPQKDWTPEQHSAWEKEVGIVRPSTLDGYDAPDIIEKYKTITNKEAFTDLQKLALKGKLSVQEFRDFADGFLEIQLKNRQDAQKADEEEMKAFDGILKKEWGAKYDENQRLIDYVIEKSQHSAEVKQLLQETPITKHPIIAKLLVELAGPFSQNRASDGLTPGAGPGSSGAITHSQDALNRIKALQADPVYTGMIRAGGEENYRINMRFQGKDANSDIQKYNNILKEIKDLNNLTTELIEKEKSRKA